MTQDHVDRVLGQWMAQRPDLDVTPMGVIGRITRMARVVDRSTESVFNQYGLTREGFDVLATLRRSGPPFRLTPTQLFKMLMISSGTMTNRLDRLENAGFICRLPDPSDRRGTLIELTAQGLELVDIAVAAHLANEAQLIASLTSDEQAQLAGLLRKLLLAHQG